MSFVRISGRTDIGIPRLIRVNERNGRTSKVIEVSLAAARGPLHTKVKTRHFSVKELPWCTPKTSTTVARTSKKASSNTSASKKNQWATKRATQLSLCAPCKTQQTTLVSQFPKFGIVAAMMESSRIIGVDQKLPWDNITNTNNNSSKLLSYDRDHFIHLTKNKILILGRKTFYERSPPSSSTPKNEPELNLPTDLTHIQHVRHAIIVSTSMAYSDLEHQHASINCRTSSNTDGNVQLHLARSFEDALLLAESLQLNSSPLSNEKQEPSLDCWIGGGERLYEEAIRHPNAMEIQLTVVPNGLIPDIASRIEHGARNSSIASAGGKPYFAFFPAKYRWDRKFDEIEVKEITTDHFNVKCNTDGNTLDHTEGRNDEVQGLKLLIYKYRRKHGV